MQQKYLYSIRKVIYVLQNKSEKKLNCFTSSSPSTYFTCSHQLLILPVLTNYSPYQFSINNHLTSQLTITLPVLTNYSSYMFYSPITHPTCSTHLTSSHHLLTFPVLTNYSPYQFYSKITHLSCSTHELFTLPVLN